MASKRGRTVRRAGSTLIFFSILATFVAASASGSNLIFYEYVQTLNLQTSDSSETQYQEFATREEIMHAECATRQRGVFYQEAVENPDQLTCISAIGEITIWFGWRDRSCRKGACVQTYRIQPGNPSTVTRWQEDRDLSWDAFTDALTQSQDMPIVIYNRDTETYRTAMLGFTLDE